MLYQATEEVVTAELSQSPLVAFSNKDIENAEEIMLKQEQVEVPLHHAFAPGVYLRQVVMPKGSLVVGHEHKTEHFNIVLSGHASVMMNGEVQEIRGPSIFVSKAGVRKVLLIHETMIWATIHPTNETNLEVLDEQLVTKSNAFINSQKEITK
jgi:quercetin dioxygenase-like cupin family protein